MREQDWALVPSAQFLQVKRRRTVDMVSDATDEEVADGVDEAAPLMLVRDPSIRCQSLLAAHIELKSGLCVAENVLRVLPLLVQYLVHIPASFHQSHHASRAH